MNILKRIIVLLFIFGVPAGASSSDQIPFLRGKILSDKFSWGSGSPAGHVKYLENSVFLVHADENTAYRAKTGLPVFESDTVVTGENGVCQVNLRDGSLIRIAPNSRLELKKHLYDPAGKIRDAAVSLFGRARFYVRDRKDFNRSDFKVTTKTMILGVRGSDFVVEAGDDQTIVSALDDTDLEVLSADFQEAAPLIVSSRQRTVVRKDELASEVTDIPEEEVRRLKSEFHLPTVSRNTGNTEQGTSEIEIQPAPPDYPESLAGSSDSVFEDTRDKEELQNIEDMADTISETYAGDELIDQQTETPWFPGTP